jgi:hypothetical protein
MPRLTALTKPVLTGVFQQGKSAGFRSLPQKSAQPRFRAAIVDHHDFASGPLGKRQHALQTAPGFIQSAINRDNYIDNR